MADGWGMSGWGGVLTAGGGGGGGTAEVSNFQPGAGTPISPSDPIQFDVTSSEGTLVAIVVTVRYPQTGAHEVAYDSSGFTVNYAPQGNFAGSTRQAISRGFRFTLRRRGGWYATPEIRAEGGDSNGNPIVEA